MSTIIVSGANVTSTVESPTSNSDLVENSGTLNVTDFNGSLIGRISGLVTVESGGVVNILSAATSTLNTGGTADNVVVSNGGVLNVSVGGLVISGAVLSGGVLHV